MAFRLVTYNMHRAIGVDRRFRLDRVVEILHHHQPDIVLLQEVDIGAPRSLRLDLAWELAHALDYAYYAAGYNVALREGRYGNATLSRHPILDERNIDLTVGFRKPRGCYYTRIDLRAVSDAGNYLELFNLHLGLSALERVRQVGLLARSEDFRRIDADTPCVVGGDFNDWRSMLTPIFTDVMGFECATDYRSGSRQAIRTYPSFSPRGGLDKVFFRGAVGTAGARVCRMKVSKVASDHLPVITDFEI